jgi:hypothetical protein
MTMLNSDYFVVDVTGKTGGVKQPVVMRGELVSDVLFAADNGECLQNVYSYME